MTDRISITRVAAHFGVAPITIKRWLADPSKAFPAPMIDAGRMFWTRADLAACTTEQKNGFRHRRPRAGRGEQTNTL